MDDILLGLVSRYLEDQGGIDGEAMTPVPGLSTFRSERTGVLNHIIYEPLICLVLQGSKRVTWGDKTYEFSSGQSLLVSMDVPAVSQVTEVPYTAIVVHLDLPLLAELTVQMEESTASDSNGLHVERTESQVAEVAVRLMRLLDQPQAIPILHGPIIRELHYWLLAGRHGAAIRRLGWPDGHVQRVSRAIRVIRANYKKVLPVTDLAAIAGMSPSSFHQHFRSVTSLSPLQFQKQLRLIEARRLITAEGALASSAAFDVGYESVSQFTREYRRAFGLPPGRDRSETRVLMEASHR